MVHQFSSPPKITDFNSKENQVLLFNCQNCDNAIFDPEQNLFVTQMSQEQTNSC